MKEIINIMLDIETLGRRSDAAITQIGVAVFDIMSGRVIQCAELKIKESEWAANHRTFSGETVQWWMFQEEHAKLNLCGGRLTQKEALNSLSDIINQYQHENFRIWTKGSLDLNCLQSLYDDLELETPWKFWQPRDMRTLGDFVPMIKVNPTHPHSALEDAKSQVKQLWSGIRHLNEQYLNRNESKD